jgi:hypothetical protein
MRRQWKREIWNTIGTSENDLGLEGTYEGAGQKSREGKLVKRLDGPRKNLCELLVKLISNLSVSPETDFDSSCKQSSNQQ